MKILTVALLAILLVGPMGCNEQSQLSDQSAYQAELSNYAKKNEEAWAAYQKQDAEEAERREKAWAESDKVLEKDKELQARWEALLTKQEQQAERFDHILQKWESMQPSAKE